MVQSSAKTVAAYLKELDPERRTTITPVLQCLRKNIREGFVESMNWGMISYEVPLSVFSDTYNGKPLLYCSVAAQKRHYAVYLMNVYAGSRYLDLLEAGYEKAGLKLKMGKCCVRFTNLDQVHLPTIGKVVRACSVNQWVRIHQASHGGDRRRTTSDC